MGFKEKIQEKTEGKLKQFAENLALQHAKSFLEEFGLDAFTSAVEHDISIWQRMKEKKRLNVEKAKAYVGYYREALTSADAGKVISTLEKIAPDFAAVLRSHPDWLEKELQLAKRDLL